MPPGLTFCCGLPRSGKSTYCNQWVRDGNTDGPPRVIIGGDDFRLALHGHAFLPNAEPQVFCHMDVAARAFLARGFDVIVDETSTSIPTIRRYLRIDLHAQVVFISCSVEECVERAMATGKPYLVHPIRRMAAQLEELKKDWDATFERLRQEEQTRRIHDNFV